MSAMEQIRGEIRDFRQATTANFNAMREDLNDLRGVMRTELSNVRTEMYGGFAEMRGKLDAPAAGIEQIANMLGRGSGSEHGSDGPA
jgi:hypothetical protein